MANFLPLKNYILFCIDRLSLKYGLKPPFLDAGCGVGDVSRHLASRGWNGTAVDSSPVAFERAKKNLCEFHTVKVEKKSIFDATGTFNTILLLDAIEHFENDTCVLKKIYGLLTPEGYLVITVPSNPKEWRWDDELYGHYRRYSSNCIINKLTEAGFESHELWDFTFPVFWFLRRLYTALFSHCKKIEKNKSELTAESSIVNAWQIPYISGFMTYGTVIWNAITRLQFIFFRNYLSYGHEMIVLARKKK